MAVAIDTGGFGARVDAAESVRRIAGHVPAIDGLRGIAVLWVMLFHYVALRDGRGDPWNAAISTFHPLEVIARNGYLGVDLFFLISGFLLALPWLAHDRSGRPAPSAWNFYRRRFWRIVPAYYVQLVVLFALVVPLLRGVSSWSEDRNLLAFNAVAHFFFLHNTTPLSSGSLGINGALWTLAVEAQYYLLVPLVAPWFVRAPIRCLAGAIILALLWQAGARDGLHALVALELAFGAPWQWPESVVRHLLATQLPGYFGHFALGIVAGRAWIAWRERPVSIGVRRMLNAGALAGLAAVYVVYGHLGAIYGPMTAWVTPVAFALVFFALSASGDAWARSWLGEGPLALLGRMSYSAYLYHLPVLVLWNAFAPPLGWATLPAYLAVVIAISWVSWRFVEQRYQLMGSDSISRNKRVDQRVIGKNGV